MASPPSADGMNGEKESCTPQKEAEDVPQPDKNRLEPANDASKKPEYHSKLHPTESPEADCSNRLQKFPTMKTRKPRQTTFIPALFYISPLDTSHALVIVVYIAVLVMSFGTRLYKLNEPDHVW